jgi:DnaK suppressor protein
MDDATTRAVLDARRADILARMAGLTAAPTDSGGISFGKRVGDGTSIAVELEELDRALVKLDEGTYGVCDRCGTPIPEGRLEVHPTAVLCVACAST